MREWDVLVQKITHGFVDDNLDYECICGAIIAEHGSVIFNELRHEAFERIFSFDNKEKVSISDEDLENDLTELLIRDDYDFNNG